jgi:hypothetical protein
LSDFRQSSLTVFDAGRFKRTAVVMLGSAPESTRVGRLLGSTKQPRVHGWGHSIVLKFD